MPVPTIDPKTGCWIWQGSQASGYGQLSYRGGGRPKWAHRVYYEEVYGDIPEGHEVHHICHVRNCVNPEHLEVLTPRVHGRQGANAKLNMVQINEIRRRALDGERTVDLAEEYAVTAQTIRDIRFGRTWQTEVSCPNCHHSFNPYD